MGLRQDGHNSLFKKIFGKIAILFVILCLSAPEMAYSQSAAALINLFRSQGLTAADVRARMTQYNITAEDLKNAGYTAEDLRNAGFTAEELRDAGVTVKELEDAGFTPQDLKNAGFSANDLRNAGFTVQDLLNAGFSPQDLAQAGVTVRDMRASGMTLSELRSLGFSAAELKASGATDRELLAAGYTVNQLKQSGSSANDLRSAGASANDLLAVGFTHTQLKNAGYSATELRSAGVSYQQLRSAGFTIEELKNAGASASDLRSVGYNYTQLRNAGYTLAQLRGAGASAKELKESGASANDLMNAGYTTAQLKDAGFTITDLRNAGATLNQLKSLGASATELKNAGYSASELKNVGYNANELKRAGFSTNEIINAQYSLMELKSAGVTATELRTAGYSVSDLKNAGFTSSELLAAGYSQSEILAAGASIKELLDSGANPKELLQSGQATPRDLLNAGITITQLKAYGVSNQDLLAAGVSVQQLLQVGVPPKELLAAGVSIGDLRNSGVTTQELVNATDDVKVLIGAGISVNELLASGVSVKKLIDAGVSTQELLAAGVSIDDLVKNGVSPEELVGSGQNTRALLAAGVSVKDIYASGVSVAELRAAGASTSDLVEAEIPLTELVAAGISTRDLIRAGANPTDLKAAGLSAEELKNSGVANRDLINAGYSTSDLLRVGLTPKELVDAGKPANELLDAGVSPKALLDAGVRSQDLKNAGVSATTLARAGITEAELRRIGFSETEVAEAIASLTPTTPDPDDPTTPTLEDLIHSELIGKILNDGQECRDATQGLTEANTCRAKGSIWNCDLNICYTQAYRDDIVSRSLQCYENETRPEHQNRCVENIKNQTVRDIAAGELCDKNTPEAVTCAASGKVYNCHVGQCLTIAQNQNLALKVEGCYKNNDEVQRNSCMEKIEEDVVVDLLTNCDEQNSPAGITCRRDPNRSYNCMAKTCLDKSFNDSVIAKTKGCISLEGAARQSCLNEVEVDVVAHIASGASCDQSTRDALACKAESKIYNCNVGYCLTPEQNQEIVNRAVQCEVSSETTAQREQCHQQLKKDAIEKVASGQYCDQNTPTAASCSAQGKIFNCNVDICLTQDENKLLTDKIVHCELDAADKDACYKEMKEDVIRHIASGKNCDPETPEAKSCKSEGKVWNCNVNFCLSEYQNDALTDEIVKCQIIDNKPQKDMCMAELEDNAINFLMTSCDISNNAEAKSCRDRGRVWNCQVNMCLSVEDQGRLVNAVKNCNAKPSEDEKKACHEELEELAQMAQNSSGFSSDKFQNPDNPAKLMHGGAAALGLAGGAMGCFSGFAVGAAGAMAVVNEMNTDSTAEASMDALRKRVEAMETKVKKSEASFELQMEVFDFSLQAIDEGIRIAEEKDSGYGMVMGMYGVALALTAVELAMWYEPSKMICGAMNVGASVLGIATVMMIKGAINKGIEELRKERAKIVDIRERFLHHFGGHGALASQENITNDASANYETGQQSVANLNPTGHKPQKVNSASQNLSTTATQVSAIARSCVNNESKPDAKCDCAKTNTCLQIDNMVSSAQNNIKDSNVKSLVTALPADAIISDTNQILRGELTAAELNRAAINKRNERVLDLSEKLMKPINESLKKMGNDPQKSINEITEDDIMAHIDRVVSPDALQAMTNRDAGRLNVNDMLKEKGLDEISEQLRQLTATEIPPGAGILPAFNFDAFDFKGGSSDRRFVNQSSEEPSESLPSRAQANPYPFDYNAGGREVHGDPNTSLFHIISNRYNILRINDRL